MRDVAGVESRVESETCAGPNHVTLRLVSSRTGELIEERYLPLLRRERRWSLLRWLRRLWRLGL